MKVQAKHRIYDGVMHECGDVFEVDSIKGLEKSVIVLEEERKVVQTEPIPVVEAEPEAKEPEEKPKRKYNRKPKN